MTTETIEQPAEQQDAPGAEAPQEGQQPAAQPAKEELPNWVPKRMSELAAARKAAEARAQHAEEALARHQAQPSSPEGQQEGQQHPNVDQLARRYAEQMVSQQMGQQQFAARLSSIEEAGKKAFGDGFDKAIGTLNTAGIGGDEFLQVISNVPAAEKVITWLGQPDNIGEAIRIASLPALQMGIELTQLSGKAAKEMSKQVSRAPAPLTGVDGGSGGASEGVEPNPTTQKKEWIAWRNKNARRK